MLNIETVDLSSRGLILPADRVGMVIAQPFLSLTDTEPYRCTSPAVAQEMIARTLELARSAEHGASKTHFTIFPEYCVPGIDGIAQIETVLRSDSWPTETVVIGGTDALSKLDFSTLATESGTHLDTAHNAQGRIGENEWINCGITWVKAADGTLERWLQPKLHPAWEEMNISHQSMFRGSSVYMFNGVLANNAPYRFATVVCFDWIASIESKKTNQWILEHLHEQASPNQMPLSWLFIIQRNPKPSHNSFMKEVETFFDQTRFPNALRDKACLVFANNAGKEIPGRTTEFGGCSIVFSPRSGFTPPTCALTFSSGGSRFRDGSDLLSTCKDFVFRERGACIHSFSQINPGSLPPGPAGRAFAVENAHVHAINDKADPRAPSSAVAACVKWLNDELDVLPSLLNTYSNLPLAAEIDAAHKRNVASLRLMQATSMTNAVRLATQGSKARNADDWERKETDAVEHLVNTLDILQSGDLNPIVAADPAHATVVINGETVDLLAIRGDSHESCSEHSKTFLPLPRRKSLLISRDKDNNSWSQKLGSILEPEKVGFSREQKFTEPSSGSLQLGYRKLLDIIQNAATPVAVQGAINAELI